MGILGNVSILIVMFSNTKLRQLSTSSLVICMAIVDCISAAFTNPLTFSLVSNLDWKTSDFGNHNFFIQINEQGHKDCRILNSATLMIFTISINLLVAISADRYWAVCQPISYHVLKSSSFKKWMIAGCVVIGIVIVSPPVLGWKNGGFSKGCFYDKTYANMFDNLNYWIYWTCCATIAIITLYSLIFKSISDRVSKFYSRVKEIFHNNFISSLNDATIIRLMNQIMKAVRLKRESLSQWGSSLAVFSSAGCL